MKKIVAIALLIVGGMVAFSVWSTPKITLEAVRDSDVSTDGGVTLYAVVTENGRQKGVGGILVEFQSSGQKFQQAYTNASGVATIHISLPQGAYRLEARYLDQSGISRLSNISEFKVEKDWRGEAYTTPRTASEAAIQASLWTGAMILVAFLCVFGIIAFFMNALNAKQAEVNTMSVALMRSQDTVASVQGARLNDWQRFAGAMGRLAQTLAEKPGAPITINVTNTAHGGQAYARGGDTQLDGVPTGESHRLLPRGATGALGEGSSMGQNPAFVPGEFKIIGEE